MKRARLLEDWRVYWNYQVHSLPKGDEVTGDLAVYLIETGSPVEDLSDPDETDADDGPDPAAVPEGSLADVLAWVGDDVDRAQRALAAELASGKPRATLVPKLEKLAGPAGGESDPDDADSGDGGSDPDGGGDA